MKRVVEMGEKAPLVSVIIPTYNRAGLVGRAIESVLGQTYQEVEMLLVDDGSTDDTGVVVKGFTDPRIVYIRHRANRGGAAARNTGLRAARGEFIAFLDSDDRWLPEKLERQLDALRLALQCGVAYCAFVKTGSAGARLVENKNGDELEKLLLQRQFVITLSTVVVRRELLNAVGGFDELLPSCQDTDLFIRLLPLTGFVYVPEPLVVQDADSADRISVDYPNRVEGYKMLISKHFRFLSSDPQGLAEYYLELGRLAVRAGCPREARHAFRDAISAHPASVKPYLHLAALAGGRLAYGKVEGMCRRLRRWNNGGQ